MTNYEEPYPSYDQILTAKRRQRAAARAELAPFIPVFDAVWAELAVDGQCPARTMIDAMDAEQLDGHALRRLKGYLQEFRRGKGAYGGVWYWVQPDAPVLGKRHS